MLSPFRSADVRLRLTALYAEVPGHGPAVRNLLYIDTRDLTFQADHGVNLATHPAAGSSAEIEIVVVATSMGDLPAASVARSDKIQAPADGFEEAVKEGKLYTLDVPVKKRGAYQIQVAVRDMATGKVGIFLPRGKHREEGAGGEPGFANPDRARRKERVHRSRQTGPHGRRRSGTYRDAEAGRRDDAGQLLFGDFRG